MNYISVYPYSAFFYVIIMCLTTEFAFVAQSSKLKITKKFFITLVILILALFAGLRDITVGKDTWAYIRAIQSSSSNYSGELFYKYYEGGFGILIKILVWFLKDPHYVIGIIALLTNALIVKTLWHFRDNYSFSFSVFLYYTLYYFETYNILRQYLAMAILFYAIRFVLEKRYVIFVMFALLSASIHGAALIGLVFIPIHIIVEKKIPMKYKVLFGLSITAFALFSSNILDMIGVTSTIEKYQTYYIHGGTGRNINIGFFFLIRFAIVLFSFYILKNNGFKEYRYSKYIILLNLLGTVLTMGGYIYSFAGRLGTYATIFEIILWSMLIKIKSKSFVPLLRIIFITLSLYLFYGGLKGSTQGHMPYRLFF